MITFRYINKLEQSNSVSYTLLIEDESKEKFEHTVRLEKTFKIDAHQIDDEFLRAEARLEINRVIYELDNLVEIPPLDLLPEEVIDGDPS
jgi:hypothetical protein